MAIGKINVKVVAAVRPFADSMRRVEGRLQQFGTKAAGIMTRFRGLAAGALGAFSAYKVSQAFKRTAEYLDELGKSSDRIGMSVQSLSNFRLAAELSGISIEEMQKALQRMMVGLGSVDFGLKTVEKAFEAINLTVAEAQRLSPEKLFMEIAKGIKALPEYQQAGAVAQIFGARGGQKLLSILRMSDEALANLLKSGTELGWVFSRLDIRMVEQMNDQWTKLKWALEAVWARLVIDVAPAFTAILNSLIKWSNENRDNIINWFEDIGNSALNAAESVAVLVDAVAPLAKWSGKGFNWLRDREPRPFVYKLISLYTGETVDNLKKMWSEDFSHGAAAQTVGRLRSIINEVRNAAKRSLEDYIKPYSQPLSDLAAGALSERVSFGLVRESDYPTAGRSVAAFMSESRVVKKLDEIKTAITQGVTSIQTALTLDP